MQKSTMLTLEAYKPEHFEFLNLFKLPEEQEKFTALPTKVLEKKDGVFHTVIVNDNVPVGFFLLHSSDRVQEYSSNPNAMLLTALSIDHSKQGQGFAKKGMEILPMFVTEEFPQCNEIVLAVNHKNIPAQNLYERVGFIDTGRRKIGKIGEQFIYSFSII